MGTRESRWVLHLISGGSEAWGRRQQGDYTHHLPKFPISKENRWKETISLFAAKFHGFRAQSSQGVNMDSINKSITTQEQQKPIPNKSKTEGVSGIRR